MLKKALALLLIVPTLHLTVPSPARADNYTYRDTTDVKISETADRDLGIYLASLVSFRRAIDQAVPLIAGQPFVKKANLSPSEIRRLAYMLINNQLSYTSKTKSSALAVTHKTKLEYESLKFPASMGKVYQYDSGDWIRMKYRIAYEQKVENALRAYLEAIQASDDPAYRKLLRDTKGADLLKKYRAKQFNERAVELAENKRYKEAVEALDQAMAWAPEYPVYGIHKAFLSWQAAGNSEDLTPEGADAALKVFSELIKRHPNESDLYALRAVAYMYQNTIPEAGLEDTVKAVELDKNNALAYLLMSLLAGETNQTAVARQALKRACALGVKNACNQQIRATPNLPDNPS